LVDKGTAPVTGGDGVGDGKLVDGAVVTGGGAGAVVVDAGRVGWRRVGVARAVGRREGEGEGDGDTDADGEPDGPDAAGEDGRGVRPPDGPAEAPGRSAGDPGEP
jgi:hypothetical protein